MEILSHLVSGDLLIVGVARAKWALDTTERE